jgi:hypothetical protein
MQERTTQKQEQKVKTTAKSRNNRRSNQANEDWLFNLFLKPGTNELYIFRQFTYIVYCVYMYVPIKQKQQNITKAKG